MKSCRARHCADFDGRICRQANATRIFIGRRMTITKQQRAWYHRGRYASKMPHRQVPLGIISRLANGWSAKQYRGAWASARRLLASRSTPRPPRRYIDAMPTDGMVVIFMRRRSRHSFSQMQQAASALSYVFGRFRWQGITGWFHAQR